MIKVLVNFKVCKIISYLGQKISPTNEAEVGSRSHWVHILLKTFAKSLLKWALDQRTINLMSICRLASLLIHLQIIVQLTGTNEYQNYLH